MVVFCEAFVGAGSAGAKACGLTGSGTIGVAWATALMDEPSGSDFFFEAEAVVVFFFGAEEVGGVALAGAAVAGSSGAAVDAAVPAGGEAGV